MANRVRSRYPNPLTNKPLPPGGEGSKPPRPRAVSAPPPGGDEAWWASLGCQAEQPTPPASPPPPLARHLDERDFNYQVDEWSAGWSTVQRTIALINDLFMARKVFEMAAAAQPDRWFTLRQRARVLEQHRPKR